jgi:hypothetical protein
MQGLAPHVGDVVNDDERALRDAWLAECWAPVREYRQTKDERDLARARTQLYAPDVDDTPEPADFGRERSAC